MIATNRDISDLIAEGLGGDQALTRDKADFAPTFWQLRTGLLGEMAQKLVNYGLSLSLTGDFSAEVAASTALRDYLREAKKTGPIRLVTPPDLT